MLVCSDVVGECTKCGAKMKLNKCGLQHMAKIVTEEQEGGEHTLTQFGEQLERLFRHALGQSTADKLLSINAVQVLINEYGIVTFAKIV